MQRGSQTAIWRDVFLDIVMFPLWWYSRGLILMLRTCQDALAGYFKYLAIGIWVKNLFVPMFGQHDWQSRLISVFMRSVQIAARTLTFVLIATGILLTAALYLILPVTLFLFTAYHIVGSVLYVT